MQIKRVIAETSVLKELHFFYTDLLQLRTDNSHTDEIIIGVGHTELVFRQASMGDPFYHFAINIPANKIAEAKEWLSHRVELIWIDQYKSDIADFVNWHAKSVYFFDPAGNIIELIARFELDNSSDEPFSPAQFISISEIGLVRKEDEFEQDISKLMQQYQLSYFEKQPPLPQFRAIGDDEGLFIVVPNKRNWFPTNKASGIYPLEIQFENNGDLFTISNR